MVEPCQKSCQIQNACTGYIGCPFPKRASMMALLILFLLHLRIRHMTTRFPTCKTHRDRARKPRAFMPGRNSPPQRNSILHVGAVGEGITPPVSVSEPDVRLSPHPAPLSESPYGYQLVRHLLA